MLKRNWHYLLLLFLLLDLSYSFWHYMQFALDGDLAPIVWPSESYARLLHDPFGLGVLLDSDVYAAPNRFFAHYTIYVYFRYVPLLLQKLMLNPVDSVYVACGLLKLAVHMLVVYVLAVAVSNSVSVLSKRFLVAAALITPFFQTSGFNNAMGIIDWSITYTAFYALPMSLLLLFFLPFLRAALHGEPLRESWIGYVGLLGLVLLLSFNGAIVPAVVLIVCPTVLLLCWYRRFAARPATEPVWPRALRALGDVPRILLVSFGLFSLLSLYSMFIGMNNSENLWVSLPLAERYKRVPRGLLYLFTGYYQPTDKYGYTFLAALALANVVAVWRLLPAPLAGKFLTVFKWLVLFAAVYVLLLPLGGYRSYREYIIRRDTILPITLGLIGFVTLSAYYLLKHLPRPAQQRYAAAVVACLALFTITDRYKASESNTCERSLFAQLAASSEPIARLPATCTLMDWRPVTDYHQSGINAELLHYWGIIKTPKRYYQQEELNP
ncbi:hypothetical protein [Hymenobacter arizonensis]|uniref:4-amino-4-deoxy-L-arabinose transferase n=1 Tax=Hymenobacter arizonensis TaxID=1227077 RepID=A0A1I5ZNE0_HYMAR|nr:hypothetical protein [Hymenobacter arizonensis]SFQ57920.1 hypothetical protein SAMN04515668_3058 [Hymenobacter arizonensis]